MNKRQIHFQRKAAPSTNILTQGLLKIFLFIILGFFLQFSVKSQSSVWDLTNGEATFQGNVGIGTTNPDSKLEVDGHLTITNGNLFLGANHTIQAVTDRFRMRSSKGIWFQSDLNENRGYLHHNANSLGFLNSSGNWLFKMDAGNRISFHLNDGTGNRELMRISANGNVGIGTNSPSELFTIHQGMASSGMSIQRDGYDDYNLSLQGGKGLIIRNNTDSRDEMVFSGTGRIGIATTDPGRFQYFTDYTDFGSSLDVNGPILARHGINIVDGVSYGHGFDIPVLTISTNQSMRASNRPTGFSLRMQSTPTNGSTDSYAAVKLNFFSGQSTNAPHGAALNALDASPMMTLYAKNEDRFIGVGIEDPVAKLDIRHSGTLGGKYDPSGANLRIGDGTVDMLMDGNEIVSNSILSLGSAYGHDISFRNVDENGHEHLMAIKSSGNVGIGLVNPEAKLDIRHSGTIGGKYDPSGANLRIGDGTVDMLMDGNEIVSNSILSLGSAYGHDISFRNVDENGHEHLMTIKSSGNVGIGITTPLSPLHIDQDGPEGLLLSREGHDQYTLAVQGSKGLFIKNRTDARNEMVFLGNGNIGIGTSAPTQKLSVNGKINAEEIILEDVAGADFVFEEDYDLRTLEETEEFIKANKHLPEVPSAAEMAEEGLELKAMNILLLQKVEELTLHLIRMEKEIQELKTAQNND